MPDLNWQRQGAVEHIDGFETVTHEVDLCVVGGGMAGMCAALAAARHGAQVLLMQDRPMLGGNASSEMRMWICGARGWTTRKAASSKRYSSTTTTATRASSGPIWDTILYEKARCQPNLTLLLNCTCNEVQREGDRIASVKGWQMTTQTWHVVKASLLCRLLRRFGAARLRRRVPLGRERARRVRRVAGRRRAQPPHHGQLGAHPATRDRCR